MLASFLSSPWVLLPPPTTMDDDGARLCPKAAHAAFPPVQLAFNQMLDAALPPKYLQARRMSQLSIKVTSKEGPISSPVARHTSRPLLSSFRQLLVNDMFPALAPNSQHVAESPLQLASREMDAELSPNRKQGSVPPVQLDSNSIVEVAFRPNREQVPGPL